ncbi:MAG: sulfur carrier protein ThiS adenylyltransferase ThiF [Desulfobacterota bacterium]|nr:sulfur carrier protein ThiS adenylyltransferase ThiF [Thermodesulfobacteriota bacterium]
MTFPLRESRCFLDHPMNRNSDTISSEIHLHVHDRQSPAITERLRTACVGIAGCGGLGTVVAEVLARAGIGKLIIVDHDVIEPSNLNRQRYTISQIGMPKVKALAENLTAACPCTNIVPVREFITAENCARIFQPCSIVAECFDSAERKAALVAGLRSALPSCIVVATSGLAGIGPGELIRTVRVSDRFYVVGDMQSDMEQSEGLFASRVGIAASMQAHVIIRIIAGVQQ